MEAIRLDTKSQEDTETAPKVRTEICVFNIKHAMAKSLINVEAIRLEIMLDHHDVWVKPKYSGECRSHFSSR